MPDDIEHFNETTYYDASSAFLGQDADNFETYKSALLDQFARRKHVYFLNSSCSLYSLSDSLKYKLATNICEGGVANRCRHWREISQTHLKQTFIRSLGPVFVCYIERFNMLNSRLPINIPEELDMSDYVRDGGRYQLMAMVNCKSTETGHCYTSLVRRAENWMAFDGANAKNKEQPEFIRSTEGLIAFYHERD